MKLDATVALAPWKPTDESIAAHWPPPNRDAVLAQTLASIPTSQTTMYPRQRRHRRGMAAVSLAAVALVVVGIIANTTRNHGAGTQHSTTPTLGYPVGAIGAQPFTGAHLVTLQQAGRLAGRAIHAPATRLANLQNLAKVWYARLPTDEGGRSVELDYIKTGIAVDYTSPPSTVIANPLATYTKMAEGLNTTVQTVHGVPALVIGATNKPSLDAPHGQPGFVDMVLDGVHIVVRGNHSAADLVAIAESIPGPDQVSTPLPEGDLIRPRGSSKPYAVAIRSTGR